MSKNPVLSSFMAWYLPIFSNSQTMTNDEHEYLLFSPLKASTVVQNFWRVFQIILLDFQNHYDFFYKIGWSKKLLLELFYFFITVQKNTFFPDRNSIQLQCLAIFLWKPSWAHWAKNPISVQKVNFGKHYFEKTLKI